MKGAILTGLNPKKSFIHPIIIGNGNSAIKRGRELKLALIEAKSFDSS